MKRWQSILAQHHNINVINDTTVIVMDVIYNTIDKTIHDDTVTKSDNGYIDSLNNTYETIYDYLGY